METQDEVYPAARVAHAQIPADPEARWKTVIPVIADLKEKAKKLGLWNLFLSKAHYPQFGVPLTNLEVRMPLRGGAASPSYHVSDLQR